MRFDIVTIFPGFFTGIFEHGIVRRAHAEGRVSISVHDLRNFAHDRHRTVDDRPFGGGEGMVLKPEPLAEALESLGIQPRSERNPALGTALKGQDVTRAEAGAALKGHDFSHAENTEQEKGALAPEELRGTGHNYTALKGHDFSRAETTEQEMGALAPEGTRVILLSAQGRPFTQSIARELARLNRIILLCGRYEGVDERINQLYCDRELSIGDYVLSGGELAAAVVADAVIRLIPGVLGNEASSAFESFGIGDADITAGVEGVPRSQHGSGGLLDYPHFTRPVEFAGLRAPEVLLNGDHQQIRRWRREQQLRKTLQNRPDLLERASLSEEDRRLLHALREERR
jgi:tRNA (guanine-N1)-methyltransferase